MTARVEEAPGNARHELGPPFAPARRRPVHTQYTRDRAPAPEGQSVNELPREALRHRRGYRSRELKPRARPAVHGPEPPPHSLPSLLHLAPRFLLQGVPTLSTFWKYDPPRALVGALASPALRPGDPPAPPPTPGVSSSPRPSSSAAPRHGTHRCSRRVPGSNAGGCKSQRRTRGR